MNNKFNLFKMIRENGAEGDERVFKVRAKVHSMMFLILKIFFGIALTKEMFQHDESFKILCFAFYFAIWMEPLIFSIKGLWESVGIAKLAVSTGCLFSILAVINILDYILSPNGIISLCMMLLISLLAGIVTYFIYAITYYNFIRKQDAE